MLGDRRWAAAFASIILLVAISRVSGLLETHHSDALLLWSRLVAAASFTTSGMPPIMGVGFLLVGLAMLITTSGREGAQVIAQAFAAAVFLVAIFALMSCSLIITSLPANEPFFAVTVNSAIAHDPFNRTVRGASAARADAGST